MPGKSLPSSALASRSWRSAAIRKTAAWGVSAPQSVRLPPRRRQPVSSMLTAGAERMWSKSPACGSSSASPVRCTIASIEPVQRSAPKSSRTSSEVSRRETRLRTASVATVAWKRGPKAPRGTSEGSSARVSAAQTGQRSRCRRCSLTVTAIGGSSATWWRCTAAASTRSSSPKTCAQARQRSGQCSTTSSTRSSGKSGRLVPSCPGWPPRARPEPGPPGRGGAEGGSCEGGSDELRELRRSRSSSFSTRASRRS